MVRQLTQCVAGERADGTSGRRMQRTGTVRITDEPETALSGVGDQRSATQVAGELGTAAVSWRPGVGDL